MKTCRSCQTAKPPADFYPKKGGRFGVSGTCKLCDNAKTAQYRQANSERIKAQRSQHRSENRQQLAERSRLDYHENKEARRDAQKKYYARTKEHRLAYNKAWRMDNAGRLSEYERARAAHKLVYNEMRRNLNRDEWRAYMAAYVRLRKTGLRAAQPAWADRRAIRDIYLACQLISKMTGVPHHVDHIVPLKGKTVCGLHIETNLQILPASDNLAKSNKFMSDL